MHQIRKIVFRSLLIVFIIFSILCGIYFSIPLFLEKKLLPGLANSIGFIKSTCEVRKFSLGRLDLASLQWGAPENPALSFDSARFDYSLPGLFKKHINKIVISGVEIRAEYKDGSIVIPGIDFNQFFQGSSDTKQEKMDNSQHQELPISFEEFEIRNAAIILKSKNENFRIPFSVKAKPFSINKNEPAFSYDVQFWLYPNLTNLLPELKFASQIDMQAMYDFRTNDLGLKLNLADMDVEYNGLQLQNSPGKGPLTIKITKKQDVISVNFSRFCIASSFPFEISMDQNTDCTLRISQEKMDMQGKIYMNFNKELVNSNSDFWLKLSDSESLPLKFKGKKRGDKWHFSLNSSGSYKPIQFQGKIEKVGFHPKILSIHGTGKGANGAARFAMKMSHVKYDSDYMHLDIPNFWMFGSSSIDDTHYPAIKAFAKLTDAEYNTGGLHVKRIHAKVPFQWPYTPLKTEEIVYRNETKRYFNIDDLKYYDMDIGAISATPYQDGLNILFAGQYKDLLPDFRINFSGRAGINDEHYFVSKVDFNAAETEKVAKIGLEKFSSQMAGMSFEGNVDVHGTCSLLGSTITSSGLIAMHNAKIESPEKKMVLEGIDLDLNMQDLYNFRSEQEQILRFKRFAWGDIEMNDGEMGFKIESSSSFFLERCGFSWCGGHVYTHGLHLDSKKRGLDMILYCDRLKLATILKQFNLASAEGEGAVNGRIPISYKDGKIIILDAFLYSTPGEGGTIRFTTDTLVPGASGIQQSIQLQIAQEALKNFNYDWAKLTLQSQGEDLVILMQMDGRPSDLLPFGFNKSVGLVKVEGQPKAHFQGIHFNLNFRLPLDKMLYYGSSISDLLQQGE